MRNFTQQFKKIRLFADKETAKNRYDICLSCDKFISATKQCSECWCFCPAKVRVYIAECPLKKWGQSNGEKFTEIPESDVPPLGDYKYKDL